MKSNRLTLQQVFLASLPIAIALTYFRAAYFGGATYLAMTPQAEARLYTAAGVSLVLAAIVGLVAYRLQNKMLLRATAMIVGIALILACIIGSAQLMHFLE